MDSGRCVRMVVMNAEIKAILSVSCVLLSAVCLAQRQEIRVWRGETLAFPVADAVQPGPVPPGIGFRLGSAKAVEYRTEAHGVQMAKALDKVVWDGGTGLHRWAEVSVPAETPAGTYDVGTIRVVVVDRVLPPARAWTYHLDLWQHPWAVARYFGCTPFSSAHYARMKPVWELLATAGQKVITTTLVDEPWDHQCADAYGEMVRHIRRSDGSWTFDYEVFDAYVKFCLGCGLGPDIACYTMCPWGYLVSYEDEDGARHREAARPGEPFFAAYWIPFLEDFVRHLETKGWLGRTYIAMDERGPKDVKIIVDTVRAHAPGLRISMAGNQDPANFGGIVIDCFSTYLKCMTDDFLASAKSRAERGLKTTYYVCCDPARPNTFLASGRGEAFWLGVYPAFAGLDGFLRWAWNSWPRNPEADASFGNWRAGDTFLVYPDGSPSIRFLNLRNGIAAAEKIRILRRAGERTKELDGLLPSYDYTAACTGRLDFGSAEHETQEVLNAD